MAEAGIRPWRQDSTRRFPVVAAVSLTVRAVFTWTLRCCCLARRVRPGTGQQILGRRFSTRWEPERPPSPVSFKIGRFGAIIQLHASDAKPMPTREYITHSAEETIALGRELAPTLKDVHVVILRGDLGAGKTTLVKGIAEGLQAASQEDVTSPTFTLIHEFHGPEVNLYHVDLYRIETERELATLGLDELFAEDGNLVVVEWGEKFPRLVKELDVEIAIERRGEQERTIRVKRSSEE